MSDKAIMGEVVRKHAGGRPQKYTKLEIATIAQDLEDYIARTADPTIVGFVSYYNKYPVNKTYIIERPEFSTLVKLAVSKQEAYLVAGATTNQLNATFAIFRLKQPQHGWSDKQEIDQNIHMVQPILGSASKQIADDADTDQDENM